MMLLILATVFLVGYSTALRIKSPPKIHPDIVLNNPYIKVVGEKLRLPCKVTGNPKPFKIWYKNNQPLSTKDERWRINRNALIIDHLELNDTAAYYCHTQNSLGEKWINYTVEVKKEIKDYTDYEHYDEDSCDVDGPPTFSKEKTIGYWIARSERSPVELKCSACGYPKPTIKWYKNKQYIDPKVKKAKYKVHGYQLDIESLSSAETGNYTCILANQHGKLNFTYLLVVLMNRVMAPVIRGPTNQTIQVGSDARFECKVLTSDLQHHTQWLQHYTVNGTYRDPNGQPYVNIIQQSMVNVTQPEVLIIQNVTKKEAGWYTCLISNPMGREYQSAWLTVIDLPDGEPVANTSSVENSGKERLAIYVITGIPSVNVIILVLLVILCYRKYRREQVGKYRSVHRVIVTRPNEMCFPTVRIEPGPRRRLSLDLTLMSEYSRKASEKFSTSTL